MKKAQQKIEIAQRLFLTEDEHILKEVSYLLSQDEKDYELSEEIKEELDELRQLRKAGKTKSYTVAEVRKYALSKIKK